MDAEVLKKALEIVEKLVGRFNSKRLIVFGMYLLFLAMADPALIEAYLASGGLVLVECLFMLKPASEGL